MTTKLGVCNLCEAICGLEFTLENGKIASVRGNADDPLSRGHVCPKAFALQDIYEDPDRLRRPVRRTATGWEEIEWDEALDLVATNLARIVNQHGRDALALYLGNPSVHSLGSMTHGTAMVKSFRTRNKYSATSVDQLPHQLVAYQMYGHQLMLPIPDIDRTQYFLLFGGNPMASNGSIMTVPDFPKRLRELKARGGRMVVFDPRHTETAKVATEHQFVRPGTDAAVLLAMLHTIFDEGLATPPDYIDGLDDVERAVAPFTPERAESVSGVAADDIRRIARELATSDAAAVHGRVGVSTQAYGLVCQWAIQCLNIVTGNLDRVGGTLMTRPAIDAVGRGFLGRGHHDLWRSRVRELPEFAGELPVATLADEILTPGDGQVKAMLTLSGNPVLSTPDGKRLAEAMAGLDFVAAIDFYVNETTRHAHVILPPASALERDHYDLIFHMFAVRNTARFTPALFPKPDDAMHDWEIYREITLRTARLLDVKRPLKQRLMQSARMRLSPTRTIDLLLRTGQAKLSVRALRKHPEGIDLGPLEPSLPLRLQTKDKRIDLAIPLVLGDVGSLDAAMSADDEQSDEDALLLIGRRHQRDNNSWMHNFERLTKGKARHQLFMHSDDLSDRGIADGTMVEVVSRVGKIEVEVQASDDMMRGVVSLPHGYGHRQPGVLLRHAVDLPGASMNDLTDPAQLDISGNAVLTGVPVTVAASR